MKSPPEPVRVAGKHTVSLTSEEVLTLGIILRKIGGSPDHSLRKYAVSLSRKLEEQTPLPFKINWGEGDSWPNVIEFTDGPVANINGGIRFENLPKKPFTDAVRTMDEAVKAPEARPTETKVPYTQEEKDFYKRIYAESVAKGYLTTSGSAAPATLAEHAVDAFIKFKEKGRTV